jgi:hypothetical protein
MSNYTDEEKARIIAESHATIERVSKIRPRDRATVIELDARRSTRPKPETPAPERGLDTMPFNWAGYIHEWREHDRDVIRQCFASVAEAFDDQRERIDSQIKRIDELQSKCFELEAELLRTKTEQFRQHAVLEEVQGRSGKIIDMPSPWKASSVKQ